MDEKDKNELKGKILEGIEAQKKLIENLRETSKPVAPDNAIGRLTRMEAINSKSISDASLGSAQVKLEKLQAALGKLDDPDFDLCLGCGNPIPHGRIMLMPESVLCVSCAGKKRRG